jgi:hypothetical protein
MLLRLVANLRAFLEGTAKLKLVHEWRALKSYIVYLLSMFGLCYDHSLFLLIDLCFFSWLPLEHDL